MAFITYTRGAVQFVTSSDLETQFLNWLNSIEGTCSMEFVREVKSTIAVKCCPSSVMAKPRKEATILTLVKKEDTA